MIVRVLGSAAGGGLPQWNCACPQCAAARRHDPSIPARTQSSLLASADGVRWVLFNASPDVRTQLNAYADLGPPAGALRGSAIGAVVLTNADIDHSAGLLVLREGGAPPLHGTARVRRCLTQGLSILPVLEAYGPVTWNDLAIGARTPLRDKQGAPLGIAVEVFAVASKPPPYMLPHLANEPRDDLAGDTIGVVITAEGSDRCVAYVPGVRDLDDALATQLARCNVILIDGTCFTDDELVTLGLSHKTAHAMGHAPLSGADGTLAFLSRFPTARRIVVHLNNSNPVLDARSAQRAIVTAAGIEVAYDGQTIDVG